MTEEQLAEGAALFAALDGAEQRAADIRDAYGSPVSPEMKQAMDDLDSAIDRVKEWGFAYMRDAIAALQRIRSLKRYEWRSESTLNRADEEENPPGRYVRWDDLLKAFEGPPD
jgi:hypothetical protein